MQDLCFNENVFTEGIKLSINGRNVLVKNRNRHKNRNMMGNEWDLI